MAITRKYAVRLSLHSGYRSSLVTPLSRRIDFLPKNCPNSSRGNQKYPRKKEKFLRKYQMKLRKNQIISPKNLPFPREQIKNIHRAIWEFLGRNWNKLIFICVSPGRNQMIYMSEEMFPPHMKIGKFLHWYSLFSQFVLPNSPTIRRHIKE